MLDRGLQVFDQIGALPREEVPFRLAAEMAIGCGLAVDWLVQAQMRADGTRGEATKLRDAHDGRFDHIITHRTGLMRIDIKRQRLGDADGISELDRAARGKACRHDVLGQIAGDVSG